MSCKSCGNTGCKGDCIKSVIKLYKPSSLVGGQTGIPGEDGDPGVGITNIVDNGDGTFTIFLSDGSDYTINLPVATGKHVVAINPVPGDDTQWELEYDDASTLIIPAAFYLQNIGSGEFFVTNQANHPTQIKSLEELSNNNKIIVGSNATEVTLNVKQYGIRSVLDFEDDTGTDNYIAVTQQNVRYQNGAGSTGIVTKTGAGQTVTNGLADYYSLSLLPYDSYKHQLNFNIIHQFDLTYNDISYQQSIDKKFFFCIALELPGGTPSILNSQYWDDFNAEYWNNFIQTVMYDMYVNGVDNSTNKHRRFAESKVCEVYFQESTGSGEPEAGWFGSGVVGPYLVFRYPFVQGMPDPGGGDDIVQRITFESKGSILVPTRPGLSNTDFLSSLPDQQKNH